MSLRVNSIQNGKYDCVEGNMFEGGVREGGPVAEASVSDKITSERKRRNAQTEDHVSG